MAGRTQTNVSAVIYDDFQPRSERKEELGANVLLIYLPGFGKDQISVTYVDSSRTIKVQGERPLDKNRRSRFNQGFPVPQNSVIEKIQGSFRNGVLTITIPKQKVDQVSSAKDANASKQTTPPKAISEQKPMEDQKETIPPSVASTSQSGIPQTPQNAITEPPKTEGPQSDSLKPAASSTTMDARQRSNGKKVEALQPPKQQEEAQKRVAPTATTPKQTNGKASGSNAEFVEKKVESEVGLKDLVKEKETVKDVKDSTLSDPNIPKTSEKEKKDDHKANLVSEPNFPKPWEKEKKDDRKPGGVVEDTKAMKGGSFMEKAKEIKGVETIMKTMKRLATDDQEERQMLINIGVSVLVIVALGAYITYSYRSSGKAKN